MPAIRIPTPLPVSTEIQFPTPTSLKSKMIVFDNSTGTSDLVQPLFTSSVPSKSAIIRSSPDNVDDFYIGDSSSQEFLMKPGDAFVTKVNDLKDIFVRVPPGATVTIYVLWEV